MFFVILLIFIFVASFLIKGFIVVNQTEALVIEYFGKYQKTLTAGLHFFIPLVEKPKKIYQQVKEEGRNKKRVIKVIQKERIPLSEQVYEFTIKNQQINDFSYVDVVFLLYFQITDPRRVAYSIKDFAISLEELITTKIKQKIIKYNYNDLLHYKERIDEEFKNEIQNEIQKEVDSWGVLIKRIMIKDVSINNGRYW